ncbi:hypothetical protein DNU06_15630 [Putridiphycobacter roseus]|uniref:DUF4468 domain-containing protein n=1 Tax=Putridiphycobacter roseus TaxID=2219161 RepID=A0A2W1MVT5_9FLAO|nr:hypothetical protein [Putridiphycobacter roseus]PZE15937.1 hypothetical protein DNU06_15630 [Putridiphycobacter roseus]
MKSILIILGLTLFIFNAEAQAVYTAKKGPRFMPGHYHVVIHVDSEMVRYELFNHWYNQAYAQYRDLTIPMDSLAAFNAKNDSLQIVLQPDQVKLVDRRYKLKKRVKQTALCSEAPEMRKISYANTIANKSDDIKIYNLYNYEDLKLPLGEFKTLVDKNYTELLKPQG